MKHSHHHPSREISTEIKYASVPYLVMLQRQERLMAGNTYTACILETEVDNFITGFCDRKFNTDACMCIDGNVMILVLV